jgi:hypothetical protein
VQVVLSEGGIRRTARRALQSQRPVDIESLSPYLRQGDLYEP